MLDALFRPHEQYIGILENLAAQSVAFSVPSLLTDRLVLHFIDNQGALANMVSGSSADIDSRAIVFDTALQLARIKARAWYEWVESAANIADLPSRGDLSFSRELRDANGHCRPSTWVPMFFSPALEARRSAWDPHPSVRPPPSLSHMPRSQVMRRHASALNHLPPSLSLSSLSLAMPQVLGR